MGAKARLVAITACVLGLSAVSARAVDTFTPIDNANSWDGSSNNFVNALNAVYGATYGNITPAPGSPLLSQTLTTGGLGGLRLDFVRVVDSGAGGPLDIHSFGTGSNDQFFSDGTGAATFQVKWAANFEKFGWYDNTTGGTKHELLALPYGFIGVVPAGGAVVVPGLSSNFGFYIDTNNPLTWYSEQSKNTPDGGLDHMIMYRVDTYVDIGGGNYVYQVGQQRTWLLGFEDLSMIQPGSSTDADFQDVIITFTTNQIGGGSPPVVPVPAAVWSGLLTLGSIGIFGVMRRRAHAAAATL